LPGVLEGGAARCMRSLYAATWGPTGRRLGTPYAVRVFWMRGLPSYGIDGCPYEVGGLGLVLFCWGFAYCLKCGGWTYLGGLGEGSLCGHVVGGLLRGALLEGLRPPSVVWWWISGASMGIPSSLLSISGLEVWCYEAHRFASRCLARFCGVCEADVRLGLELDGVQGRLCRWARFWGRVLACGRWGWSRGWL
jgi:hypothetical protein